MITRFGTAKEMVIMEVPPQEIPAQEASALFTTEDNSQLFIAIDDKGLYLTQKKYLDKSIADPNRYSNRRVMEQRIQELGFNYKELFESNKDRIQKLPKETVAKVNPLKASKRGMKH